LHINLQTEKDPKTKTANGSYREILKGKGENKAVFLPCGRKLVNRLRNNDNG